MYDSDSDYARTVDSDDYNHHPSRDPNNNKNLAILFKKIIKHS